MNDVDPVLPDEPGETPREQRMDIAADGQGEEV